MRRESFQGKAKSGHYSRHVSLYSTVKCMREEHSQSEKEVRVPHCRESNLAKASCSHKVGWTAATRKSRKSGRRKKPRGGATQGEEPQEGVAFRRKTRKSNRAEKNSLAGEAKAGGLKRGWGWVRESGGARRRRRRVRERSCGDGECASFWQTS
eukprot:6174546-Pleurochrysis_carterae.AAC.1